ncbi:ATP-binding protein [Thalassovita taeanensis]|uniref:histidine kinase n=1 Tax=Thalassovita taeanensis TaxID=657014 RepID=A0A1H9C415_9RHOB|nr:ATP-binding protein [Thalassovita taeanensis]SEP95892.1 PAS domain S-box-containing protein [Thalassovita taeanensis]
MLKWAAAVADSNSLQAFPALWFATAIILVAALLITFLAWRKVVNLDSELLIYKRALDEHCMITVINPDWTIKGVNEKFLKTSGFDRSELLGKSIHQLYPPDFYDSNSDTIQANLLDGKIWAGETHLQTRSGEAYWTQTTLVPVLDAKGRLKETIGLRTDITKLKTFDAEVQLRETLDLLRDEVYMFTPDDFHITYMNHSARARLGWPEDGYQQATIPETHDLIDMKNLRRKIRQLSYQRERSITFEIHHDDRSVEISLQLVQPAGNAPRYVAVVRDVTARNAATQAKSEFVSMVSHELRTPLTSIKGALGLVSMAAENELPERVNSILAIAKRNTDRLILLINDILDLDKIDSERMPFQLQEMNVAEFLAEAVEANEGYALECGVRFVGQGLDQNLTIDGDPDRLMQVMSNLMSNAAKFSPVGENVEVGMTDMGRKVRIWVKDKGCGIPEKSQPHILERFQQVDSSDRRKVNGTGLGLSVVKAIIEKHGSQIQFESKVGQGSKFYFDMAKYSDTQEIRA